MRTGYKESSTVEIAFQSSPASSELSCCSVNAPRIFGMVCEWAVMRKAVPPPAGADQGISAVVLNYYGASTITVPGAATLVQTTDYPYSGTITIAVTPAAAGAHFELHLRIPAWSARSTVALNGAKASTAAPGGYHVISRAWAAGDKIVLNLDFRLRGWVFGQDFAGTHSRGAAASAAASSSSSRGHGGHGHGGHGHDHGVHGHGHGHDLSGDGVREVEDDGDDDDGFVHIAPECTSG